MVAKPDKLDNFIFNSDYPTDKIVWLYEGDMTTSANGTAQTYIVGDKMPYKQPIIYVKGQATMDNWQTSFMLGTNYPFSGSLYDSTSMSFANFPKRGWGVYLYVYLRDHPNTNIKFRLWGVQRDDIAVAADYGKTAGISENKLVLDTGKNYPRIYKEGIAMSGETIYHNLGKIPFIDFWYTPQLSSSPYTKDTAFQYGWQYAPRGHFGTVKNGMPSVRVTEFAMYFDRLEYVDETKDAFYYYRIYA